MLSIRQRHGRKRAHVLFAALFALGLCTGASNAQQGKPKRRYGRIPVVMEQSTVRGKVIILESRQSDRRVIGNLTIEVWSISEERDRQSLIHSAKTDEDGLFSLPSMDTGEYLMFVSELPLRLLVVPTKEQDGQAQAQEPKILLIMIPKESV